MLLASGVLCGWVVNSPSCCTFCTAGKIWIVLPLRGQQEMKNICISKRTGRQFLSCLEYRRNQNLTLCNCFSGAPAKIVICFLEVCYYGCYQFVALNFNESMLMVHSPPICYQLVTSNLQAMLLKFSINVLHYCLCSLCGPEEYTLYAKPKMYC